MENQIDFTSKIADAGTMHLIERQQGPGNPRYADDDKLYVQFHVSPVLNPEKSAEAGRPIFDDVEHVRIMAPGNKESIPDKVVTAMERERFAKQYKAWKEQGEVEVEGTRLEHWPPLTRAQVEEMKFFHVFTVEQLAAIPDAQAQKFMGLAHLKKMAEEYLAAAKEAGATTRLVRELEQRDNKIQTLENALKSMQEQIQAMQEESKSPQGRRKVAG